MEESKRKIKRVNKWNRLGFPKHHDTGMKMMQKRKEIQKIWAREDVWFGLT